MNSIIDLYSHIPSPRTIACGAAFGIARIWCGKTIEDYFSLSFEAKALPQSYSVISLMVIKSILVPFLEEAIYRKNLDNPTLKQVIKNSVVFGLVHGILPGSKADRITRVFLSTIGGLFYCSAKIAGGDVWSPAIAHSMYNLRWLAKFT